MQLDYRDLGSELRQHLDADERLIWTGIPKQGFQLRGSDIFMIPFSLVWGGLAISWEFDALQSNDLLFVIWGIPFVLVGLYIIFGRFFYDSVLRKRTVYGITQNRIIIKYGVLKSSIKSLDIRALSDVTINEMPDGSGTIMLGPESLMYGMFRGSGWPGTNTKLAPALEMIPEARKVYRRIIDLQKEK